MSKESLSNVAQGVLAICVFGLVGFLLMHRTPATPPGPAPALSTLSNWRDYASDGNRIGPPDASVTIIEFADFQCPFCSRMAVELQDIRKRYPQSVAILFRHYPLTRLHPYALAGAIASECAADQSRFQSFYDRVYGMQDSIATTSWVRFASLSGVPDTAAFKRCLESDGPRARVQADVAAGLKLGISGTPTLLVDSVRVDGMLPETTLDSLVQLALRPSAEQ